MVKNFRLYCVVLYVFIAAFQFHPAWAYSSRTPDTDGVTIQSNDSRGIAFTFRPGKMNLDRIETARGDFDIIGLEDGFSLNKPGYPSLPARKFYIALPPGSSPQTSVSAVIGTTIFESLKPAPFEDGQPVIQPQSISKALYSQNVGKIRDMDVLTLTVLAANYNPAIKTAAAYRAINIDIRFNDNDAKRYETVGEDRFARKIMKSLLLNYENSKGWHYRLDSAASMASGSPFDSAFTWLKFRTTQEGIHKIDYYTLSASGVPLAEIDPRTIRVFGSEANELPPDNDDPYPMLRELPIYVYGSEDGSFDKTDYIFMYAPAVNRFEYDSTSGRDFYHYNHYTAENSFFFTYGTSQFNEPPRRWSEVNIDVTDSQLPTASTFYDFIRVEQNKMLWRDSEGSIQDFYEWYWESGTSFDRFTNEQLFDVVAGDTGWVYSQSRASQATVKVNGQPATFISYSSSSWITTSQTFNFQNGLNELEFGYSGNVTFNYFDLQYNRGLSVVNDHLRFRAPRQAGTYIFSLNNADPQYLLLDITDPLSPRKLVGGNLQSNSWRFQYASEGLKSNFFYAGPSSHKTVSSMESYSPAGLRSISNSADGIIIVYDSFRKQAERLASHRSSFSGLNYYIADLSDVYNEFGWGRSDPLAIRYFLRYAFENWNGTKPVSCTLIGDGHYDYLDNYNLNIPSYLPPFEYPLGSLKAWASDDNYVFFGAHGDYDSDNSGFPDMIIGRLPVKSADQLSVVIDKIIDYDAGSDLGEWKNTITIVADDQFSSDSDTEWFHTSQAETLSKYHTPPSYKLNKIYAIDYPMEEGRTKPLVRKSIIDSFNNGSLIINYIGHGNKNVWMHEHTFRKTEDLPHLTNRKRLPLVFAASCSIGDFDDPTDEGMAEDLLRASNGGAISVASATRGVYAGENAALNNAFFDYMLSPDSLSISEAFYVAKLSRGSKPNDWRYTLFGDPEQTLGKPDFHVAINSVVSGTTADTLSALALVTVTGQVQYQDGTPAGDFNGVVYLNAYDALRVIPYGTVYTYKLPGNILFRGPSDVQNSIFTSRFLMPKDIDYGQSTAKIIAYTIDENQNIDGAGYRDSLYLGRATEALNDSLGPTMTAYIDNKIVSGSFMTVGPSFNFMAVLTDSSGINMTGQAGHYISLVIDHGESLNANVTDYFEYDMNNYQTGTLDYRIEDLATGDHHIELKAWDNFNNSALKSFTINVVSQEQTELLDVMNYPNPFKNNTVIQYRLNRADISKVEVKIYTLSGLWIRTLKNCPSDNSYNFVEWDGRDADGDEIANGVYIYSVIAAGPGGRSENIQKALKLR